MIDRRLQQQIRLIRPLCFAHGLISFALTALIIGQMACLSVVIDGAFMKSQSIADLMAPLSMLLGLIVARGLLIALHQSVSQRGAIRIKSALRAQSLTHLFELGPARLSRERTGELTATLTDGLEKIDAYFSRYIPRAIHVMIAPLLIAGFALWLDPISGAILLATGPLIPLFMWLIGTSAQKRTQKQWSALSRMSAHFLDVLQGLTTLKLFGHTQSQEQDIRRISNRYRLTTMGVLKIAFLSGLALELAASLSTAIVAVQIGVRLIEGHLLFQPGLLILLLAPEFYLPFRQLGTEHHAAMEGKAASDRLFEVLDTPAPIRSAQPVPPPDAPFDLHLSGVTFTYPDRTAPALEKVTATFEAGKVHALVGPSGAGKSTLFHLMTRQLDPAAGGIRAGVMDLATLDHAAWRKRIALVPQKPTLFRGTVADNLRMARPDASDDDLESAARQAEAHAFIAALPHGYNTPLGEQAWRLSGGERQRLAIARAFLKDAPVLLLDEPSANLDPESEELIATAIERLSRNRLTLVIAHRLRTIYRADTIWVLQQGRLIESGTHSELLKSNGFYARLMGRGAA